MNSNRWMGGKYCNLKAHAGNNKSVLFNDFAFIKDQDFITGVPETQPVSAQQPCQRSASAVTQESGDCPGGPTPQSGGPTHGDPRNTRAQASRHRVKHSFDRVGRKGWVKDRTVNPHLTGLLSQADAAVEVEKVSGCNEVWIAIELAATGKSVWVEWLDSRF